MTNKEPAICPYFYQKYPYFLEDPEFQNSLEPDWALEFQNSGQWGNLLVEVASAYEIAREDAREVVDRLTGMGYEYLEQVPEPIYLQLLEELHSDDEV